jgi:hypothetical protein
MRMEGEQDAEEARLFVVWNEQRPRCRCQFTIRRYTQLQLSAPEPQKVTPADGFFFTSQCSLIVPTVASKRFRKIVYF